MASVNLVLKLTIASSMLHAGPTPSAVTYAIMIYGLCKEGHMGKATDLLLDMEVKGLEPSIFTFNMLMHGFIQNNEASKVVELLCKMEEKNVTPDASIVFIVIYLLAKDKVNMDSLPAFPARK